MYIDYEREGLAKFMTHDGAAAPLVKDSGNIVEAAYNLHGDLILVKGPTPGVHPGVGGYPQVFGVLPGYPKGFCGARGEPPGRQAARCAGVQRHASAAVDAPRPGGGLWGSPTAGARPFLAPRGAPNVEKPPMHTSSPSRSSFRAAFWPAAGRRGTGVSTPLR